MTEKLGMLVEKEQWLPGRQRRELPAEESSACCWVQLTRLCVCGRAWRLKDEVQGPDRYLGPGLWAHVASGQGAAQSCGRGA